MPSGTMVKMFAPRIHKSNASEVFADAQNTSDFIEKQLIALAASNKEPEEIVMQVESLLEDDRGAQFNMIMARRIIENPEDCEDELE